MNIANNNLNEDQYESNEGENKHEDTANSNHPFTENAEPDYANDLISEEFSKERYNNEKLGQEDHSEKLDNNQFDKEHIGQNTSKEFNTEKLYNEVPDLNQETKERKQFI